MTHSKIDVKNSQICKRPTAVEVDKATEIDESYTANVKQRV
jgi:hypothetical protein